MTDATPARTERTDGRDAVGVTARTLEVEVKYDVPQGWRFPRLAPEVAEGLTETIGPIVVSPPRRWTQVATYVDTPTLTLLAARHTLRRRVGGTDAGWHLKTPAVDGARGEVHAELGGSAVRVPSAIRAEVTGLVGADPLVPIAVLRTRRTERQILDSSGRVLAVVVDDRVRAASLLTDYPSGAGTSEGAEEWEEWREIEVELVDGERDILAAVGDALVAAGLTPSRSSSKLARTMGPARDVVAARSADPRAHLAAYLAAQVGVLQTLESAVRADAPDAVHKARVATRRLRSTLRTFRPLLDASAVRGLRAEVTWMTRILGAPRDAEVLRDLIVGHLDELPADQVVGPVRARVTDALDAEHAKAHAAAVRAMDSRRWHRTMRRLLTLAANVPWRHTTTSAERIVGLVDRALAAVARAADDAETEPDVAIEPRHAGELDRRLHEVRKKAKAARYAVEAGRPHVSGSTAASLAHWEEVQEQLGALQDSVVARDALRRLRRAARARGESVATYDAVIDREEAVATRVRSEYPALLVTALQHQ